MTSFRQFLIENETNNEEIANIFFDIADMFDLATPTELTKLILNGAPITAPLPTDISVDTIENCLKNGYTNLVSYIYSNLITQVTKIVIDANFSAPSWRNGGYKTFVDSYENFNREVYKAISNLS